MSLGPYKFVPKYSLEEIISRHYVLAATILFFYTTAISFVRALITHLKYCLDFLSKIYV